MYVVEPLEEIDISRDTVSRPNQDDRLNADVNESVSQRKEKGKFNYF